MKRPAAPAPFPALAVLALAAALSVAGCAANGSSTQAGSTQTGPLAAGQSPAGEPAGQSGSSPTAEGSPVPGNSVIYPIPSDVPAPVASKVAERSCGSIVSFEVDPDVSPAPTLPTNLTSAQANDAALACLMSAWRAHGPAVLETHETTDEQDQIFTIYRLPGDGTVDLIVRLDSWTEKTVTWTETTCRDLTLQDGRPTPLECDSEHAIH